MNLLNELKQFKKTFFLCVFTGICILVSYNWVRSASPALFMQYYSKDLLPMAMAVMSVSLVFVLYLYNKVLTRFGPCITFHISNLFFAFLIIIHALLLKAEIAWSTFSLFVVKDIYVMIMIEQIWSYFNTANTSSSAKKLSGPMMAIVSIGPIVSGKALSHYAPLLGSEMIVFWGGVFLIPASFIFHFALKDLELKKEEKNESSLMGVKYFKEKPILFALLLIIFISQILAATTTLRLQSAVGDFITSTDEQTAYFGNYYSNINSLAAFFQLIITPLVLSFIPLGVIHITIPLIHITLGFVVLTASELQSIMLASVLFKSIDYSIFKGAKELIYVPLNDQIRYRTKQVIDVFGYRFGKGFISTVLGIIKSGFKVPDSTYSMVAFGSSIIWLFLGFFINKRLKMSAGEATSQNAS